jgi:hypothetical protein
VEPSPNNRLVANSRIPLKTSLRWIGFDCGIVYALNSRFFNPIWIDYYSLTKVLKENRSSAGRFQVY